MRSSLLFFVIFASGALLQAQVTKIATFDFDELPIINHNANDQITHFRDNGRHIVSVFRSPQGNDAMVYNEATGAFSISNIAVQEQFKFGDEKVYRGIGTESNSTWRYYQWLPEGNFSITWNIPVKPQLIYNGKGYGISGTELLEITPSSPPRVLATHYQGFHTHSVQMDLVNDTLYIAHNKGLDIFSLSTENYTRLYTEYFEHHQLELIPFSGKNGRFLYNDRNASGQMLLHELGHGMSPRLLPQGANPPNFAYAFWSGLTTHIREGAIAAGDSTLWMTFPAMSGPNNRVQQRLIKVDRRKQSTGVSLESSYLRLANFSINSHGILNTWGTGDTVVALGIYGPKGYEPYVSYGDGVHLLKDLQQGPRGSLNHTMEYSTVLPTRLSDTYIKEGKVYFAANADYHGMELCVSDATSEGTFIFSDIEHGVRGIREVKFTNGEGDILYALVQGDDHRPGLYRIGPELVPYEPSTMNEDGWEERLSGYPEYFFNTIDNHPSQWQMDAEGAYLYFLSPAAARGTFMFDQIGEFYFPETAPNMLHRTQRIMKFDAHTGAHINSKPFINVWSVTGTMNARLFLASDGRILVLRSGRGYYGDDDHQILLPTPTAGLNQLFMTSFDEEGNFLDIVRIPYNSRLEQMEEAVQLPSGEMVVLVNRNLTGDQRTLLRINDKGEVLNTREIRIPLTHRVAMWEDGGLIYLADHPELAQCENCPLSMVAYNPDLSPQMHRALTFTGRLQSPRMHNMPNGELWFTGALNGQLLASDGRFGIASEALASDMLNPFLVREFAPGGAVMEAVVFDEQVIRQLPAFMHKGNLFLQFVTNDNGHPNLDPFWFFRFFNDHREWQFHIAQLDGLGQLAERRIDHYRMRDPRQEIPYSQQISNGHWQRCFSANSATFVQPILGKVPPELFAFGWAVPTHFKVEPWPFEPLEVPERTSEANENDKHLRIFPNPSIGGRFAVLPVGGANMVPYDFMHVFDIQGRLVFERNMTNAFNGKEIQLPPDLHVGIYSIRFSGREAEETHRLVIIK